MNFFDTLVGIVLIYLLFSIFVFFLINSNILPHRFFQNYKIEIPVKLRYLEQPKLAYWVANQSDDAKTVILLHGFTRSSGRMNRRAKIYWELGYNIYLVDNLGHGKSKFILFPSGFQYSWEVRRLIKEENIVRPILHGVSMGAIAAAYIAQKEPQLCETIICEALPYDFSDLYVNMMKFMKIPYRVFFWIESFSRMVVWRKFKDRDASYDVSEISCPLYYIHSEEDRMFRPEYHYEKIITSFSERNNFVSWLVPGAKHTRMDQHQEYEEKLIHFLSSHG
ncbi:MAG: alpha/beta fold hydrolase [Candidatus Kariarchaeaceae archaeon]|jgi:pimeloyl-ACP methyl ester carboxylesterase